MLDFLSLMFSGGGPFTLNVTTSVAQPNFRQMALDAGWNGYSELIINVTAPLVNTVRFTADMSFPQGVTLKIGAGTRVGGVRGAVALFTRVPLNVDNAGILSGGGGYGGEGQGVRGDYNGQAKTAFGGAGSPGQGFQDSASLTIVAAGNGSAGQRVTWDEVVGGQPVPWLQGGQGGGGGSWGFSGGPGSGGTAGNGATVTGEDSPATAGSPAGPAVDGNSFITWLNTGTRLGPIS